VGKTLYTQNWKGAIPNLRRRESWRRKPEKNDSLQLTKKRRLPRTETTKYETSAEDGTLTFNQPQTEREPMTKNDQTNRRETTKVVPNTEIRMPNNTGRYEKPGATRLKLAHHKNIQRVGLRAAQE